MPWALRRFLSWKGFYPIAQISYSTYMVHEMIFLWLFPKLAPFLRPRFGADGAMFLDAAIGVVIVFTLACALYVLIERPCMRMRSHPATLQFIDTLRARRPEPAQLEA